MGFARCTASSRGTCRASSSAATSPGTLTAKAAAELGLCEGTPVYGGGGDATLIGVGAGATEVGQTHIYSGTSGWVGTVMDHQAVDVAAMMAGIVGAEPGKYNYFAEMETAGKCFEWVKDHLVLDEVNVYLAKTNVAESRETVYESLYDYMSDTVAKVAPGSGRRALHAVAARQPLPV